MRALAGGQPFCRLLGLGVERLVDCDVQRDDCIAVRISLLGTLKELKMEFPKLDPERKSELRKIRELLSK